MALAWFLAARLTCLSVGTGILSAILGCVPCVDCGAYRGYLGAGEGVGCLIPVGESGEPVGVHVRDEKDSEQEARRIWRVLYHHMKSIFEAADSGVMEFRELMLPYIMTNDGKTVAEHILPKLDAALAGRPDRLLPYSKEAGR